jgi:tripartite motif-containing protein 71
MKTKIYLPILILSICANLLFASELGEPDIQLKSVVKSYSDRQQFGNPTGIFLDNNKHEIYLADPGNHQIGIFDMRGTTLWSFKHWVTDSRTGQRMMGDPHSLVVTHTGDIIISDNKADYLDIFDYRGTLLQQLKPEAYENVAAFRAAALALDSNGNLYIGTRAEKTEILILDSNYELIRRFGEKGEKPENFDNLSAIWVAGDSAIYVTDALAVPVVKRFSMSGEYLGGFGDHTIEKNDFSLACGVVTTAGGRVWVADQLRQVVKCVGPDGKFITMIGGLGNKPGDLSYPSAVASDGDTLLIIAEKNGNRFQQFVIR